MKFKIISPLLLLLWLVPAGFVAAESLMLKTSSAARRVGDVFQVSVSVNTDGRSINTIGGKIAVPASLFETRDIRYGTSVISLWVEKPKWNPADGFITFTGGTPGGFNGSSGPVLQFWLKAKKSGVAELSVSGVSMLLNDGLGTEVASVRTPPLRITVQEALPPAKMPKAPPVEPVEPEETPQKTEEQFPAPDATPPEEFVPLVSRHPSVSGNRYFVSFSTVDKDTGVAHYTVSETPLVLGRLSGAFGAQSGPLQNPPYVLRYQHMPTKIVVRAYDQAGNAREAGAEKPASPLFVWIIGAVLALCIGALFRVLPRRGSGGIMPMTGFGGTHQPGRRIKVKTI